mgnify:CR=1 FL=1
MQAVLQSQGAKDMAATEAGLRSAAYTDAAGRLIAKTGSFPVLGERAQVGGDDGDPRGAHVAEGVHEGAGAHYAQQALAAASRPAVTQRRYALR